MRVAAFAIATLASFLAAQTARADAYSWGGASGSFRVDVFVSGFNEGAGAGGWSESSARDFAAWAARFNAILPAGMSVSMSRDVSDDETTLTIKTKRRTEVISQPGGPDFDAALSIVARRVGVRVPPPPVAPSLFTLQVFAARSRERATKLASVLDERGVEPTEQVFYEQCHPCFAHPARVLDGGDGFYRVIVGVYDRLTTARRALARLERDWKLSGFVRKLD
jgi:hypothetical protein